MRKLGGIAVTVGLLAGMWGVLAWVGWVADVLPSPEAPSTPGADAGADSGTLVDTGAPRARDSGAPAPAARDAGASSASASSDGGAESDAEGAQVQRVRMRAFPLPSPERHHVTSLLAGQLLGDERPEIVVGLGERFDVLSPTDDPSTLRRRIVVRQRAAKAKHIPSSPRAAIGDVTGDGDADLALGFWRRAASGGSRGGGAWLLRSRPDDRLSRPVRFAGPGVMATSVSVVDLDGRGALDLVVADRGRPWGDIAGRIHVFAGAGRPRRLAKLEAPKGLRRVLPAHADGDDRIDLVAVGEVVVRFRNAGRGELERMEGQQPGVLFADVSYGYSGDLDGDERLEAYAKTNAEGDRTVIVDSGGVRSIPFQFDPAEDHNGLVHRIRKAADVNGDGRAEALVLHSVSNDWRMAYFDESGEPTELRRLHGGHPRRGHDGTVVDLDGDGALELITLDSVYDSATQSSSWELTVTPLCVGCAMGGPVEGRVEDPQALATHEVR